MIRHIIFDMGGVLRVWDPAEFMETMGIPADDRKILMREIFSAVEWPMQDIGLITEEETLERVSGRIPGRLRPAAEKLILHWEELSRPIPGMADAIGRLKENGYGMWLLSNASKRHGQYWGRIPGSEYFDGLVISAFEGVLKPDLTMYRTILSRFGLKAEECVFTDDMPANVAGALAAGIDGFVFRGTDDFIRELKERGVRI
jgi:putative hydrolase of the HAD superfamily